MLVEGKLGGKLERPKVQTGALGLTMFCTGFGLILGWQGDGLNLLGSAIVVIVILIITVVSKVKRKEHPVGRAHIPLRVFMVGSLDRVSF